MKGRTLVGAIIVLIGLSILFKFPIFHVIVAFFVIWVGVKIISGKDKDYKFNVKGNLSEDRVERVLVFSGINLKLTSANFKGGELVSIFGGGEIDASKVISKDEVIDLDVVAIFGGFKIKIPKTWEVKSEGAGIVGAFNNMTELPTKPTNTLRIKGVAIFGGVEIVN